MAYELRPGDLIAERIQPKDRSVPPRYRTLTVSKVTQTGIVTLCYSDRFSSAEMKTTKGFGPAVVEGKLPNYRLILHAQRDDLSRQTFTAGV